LHPHTPTLFPYTTLFRSLRDEFSPLDWLKVNLGVRYSGFKTNGQLYHNIEPRLAMNANLSDRFNLKASYTRMNQYIHLVASNGRSEEHTSELQSRENLVC